MHARVVNAAAFVLANKLADGVRDTPAVVSATETLTYGELVDRVSRFAAALHERGLRRGERCAILMLDTPDLVATALAVMAAGGVAVLLSPRATVLDLRDIVEIARPFAFVADERFAGAARDALRGVPDVALLTAARELAAWKRRPRVPFEPVETTASEPAFWVVSSGTTGRPEGVEHRHENIRSCTDYFDHMLGVTASDRLASATMRACTSRTRSGRRSSLR